MNSSVKASLLAGITSSVAVAVTAAACAGREQRSPWRPINAISHIYWGPRAAERTRFSLRYTGLGLVLNLVACWFWALLYETWSRAGGRTQGPAVAGARGLAVSALAYVTDYGLVPARFTPGFELSLSRQSFPWVYGALAVGVCLPDLLRLQGQPGGRA